MRASHQLQRKHLLRLLLENHFQLGIEHPGRQTKRQRVWQIRLQTSQIEAVQIKIQFTLMATGKRFAAPLQRQRSAVDGSGKTGLHQNLSLIRQAGNKRQGQIDLADTVLLALGLIIKLDAGINKLNVIQ